MFSIRKFFSILLAILLGLPIPTAFADGYSTGFDQEVMDEAAARRALAEIPDFKMDNIWFATGLEGYYKSPSCITGRDLFIFTKPIKSSPGLWRGKKSFLTTRFKGPNNIDCNKPDYTPVYALESGSFIDPDTMHPEEAFDGEVPGIFEMRVKMSDAELLNLSKDIEALYTCLKNSNCPYPIELKFMGSHKYGYLSAVKLKNLSNINKETQGDKPCYSVMSTMDAEYGGLVVIELFYVDGKVSKVTMDDMVIE